MAAIIIFVVFPLLIIAAFMVLSYRDANWEEVLAVTSLVITLLAYLFSLFMENVLLLLLLWISIVITLNIVWREEVSGPAEQRETAIRAAVGLLGLSIILIFATRTGLVRYDTVWLLTRLWPVAFILSGIGQSRPDITEKDKKKSRWSRGLSLIQTGIIFCIANAIFFFTTPTFNFILDMIVEMRS